VRERPAPDGRQLPLSGLRGRTRPGRLTLLDALLCARERELLCRTSGAYASAVFVDVGIGDEPDTTLETARAFTALHPELRCIGVDVAAARVERARRRIQRLLDPQPQRAAAASYVSALELRVGGFALPLTAAEPARLVRAMNVLRNYPEADVPAIHAALCEPLLPGGLLVEGSSSRRAGNLCAHLIRKHANGARREALCFASSFSEGFAPRMFRDCLPRDLRRHVRCGEAIGELLFSWQAAFERVRAPLRRRTPRQLFDESAVALAERLPQGSLDLRWLPLGCLLWHPDHAAAIARTSPVPDC